MKKIKFIVEKTNDGYSAYSKDWDNTPVGTTGDNLINLKNNLIDALNTYYEALDIDKVASIENIELQMDLTQFFEFYKVINASNLGERIGMNKALIYQYISGNKTPSEKQINKILTGLKDLGRELSAIDIA